MFIYLRLLTHGSLTSGDKIMTENLKIWDKLKTPPAAALKEIQAGRMKGKTDINPQWRIKAMTEVFGPVGIGWKYSIDKLWTEPGSDNQICAFALVSVYVKNDDVWSDAVPGSGGSMLIAKEKNGLFTSDEAFKMATTDALSVALKAIGVAADVYMGIMDGSKYPASKTQEQSKPNQQDPERANLNNWLDYIDKFTDKSLDQFTQACEAHINAAIDKLPEAHGKELTVAKKEMLKHLGENK